MRQSIINKGVEVPEDVMIEDLPEYIAQIEAGGGYDPSNPTLEGLKAALDAGDYSAFPANSTIPDTYDGADFNWVVGHYGTATMPDGSTQEGVYLFKEKALDGTQAFGSGGYYDDSAVNSYLNGTYLSGCSDTFKNLVSEISVPVYANLRTATAKLWLMSVGETLCQAPTEYNGGGVAWDAWKIRTGLSAPSSADNNGRAMYNSAGDNVVWWTRSLSNYPYLWVVYPTGGALGGNSPTGAFAVLPACFIAKGGN